MCQAKEKEFYSKTKDKMNILFSNYVLFMTISRVYSELNNNNSNNKNHSSIQR